MLLAYIDPGLGSLLWQGIISAFIGFLFYLKKTRRMRVNFFRTTFRSPPRDGGPAAPAPLVKNAAVKPDAR